MMNLPPFRWNSPILGLPGLPVEITMRIFYELPYRKIFDIKRVCRSWNQIIRAHFRPTTLIVCFGPFVYDREWFRTNELIEEKHALKVSNFSIFFNSQNLRENLNNLKKLICSGDTFNLSSISIFVKLEQLEIRLEYNSEQYRLNLPNLKYLYIVINKIQKNKIILSLPNCKAFKTSSSLSIFEFQFPATIEWMEVYTIMISDKLKIRKFENLKYLYCFYLAINPYLREGLTLVNLPNLIKIQFYQTNESRQALQNEITQLNRQNLQIQFIPRYDFDDPNDLRLMQPDLEYRPPVPDLQFLDADTYGQYNYLPFYRRMDYNNLIQHFNQNISNSIPNDFYSKFESIEFIFVNQQIQENEFLNFLRNLKKIRFLKFDGVRFSRTNELPIVCPFLIEFEWIYRRNEQSPIDMRFVASFRNLIYFHCYNVSQERSIITGTLEMILLNCKYLNKIEYKNDQKKFQITFRHRRLDYINDPNPIWYYESRSGRNPINMGFSNVRDLIQIQFHVLVTDM